MRVRTAHALTLLALLGAANRAQAAEPLRLETTGKVDALKTVDVDGDGVTDVVVLSGRTVSVWTGAKDAPPAAAPRWKVELPGDVSFVDVARADRPSLLCLGKVGALRLRLGAGSVTTSEHLLDADPLGWRDGQKAVFAPLHPGPAGDPTCLLPTSQGWAVRHDSGFLHVLTPWREVTPAGPFLEDTAAAKEVLPVLFTNGKPTSTSWGAHPAHFFWSLAGDKLVCLGGPGDVTYDLSFLPGGSRVRLVDLDGDGRPEVATGEGDNREARFAFFRVPEPELDARADSALLFKPVGRDLRPPAAFLKLSGFNLEPTAVDLDGDGLQDFVQTTIGLDPQNTMRAMMTGKVTATTLAFLQRRPGSGTPMFESRPDAVVVSDIWVRVRFQHAGTLDVARSFTILVTADVDGDGRKDLVIRGGPGTLAVRRGTASGVWAQAATDVGIPPLGPGEELEAQAADLDGRPGDELLLVYRAAEQQPDRLLLLR